MPNMFDAAEDRMFDRRNSRFMSLSHVKQVGSSRKVSTTEILGKILNKYDDDSIASNEEDLDQSDQSDDI